MGDRTEATPRETMVIGALFAAGGLYLVLISLGLVPSPGEAHGPAWLVLCVGLAVLLAGLAAILQGLAGASPVTGELPPGAPRWMFATQLLLMPAIMTCFAMIGSWIAFGPGSRSFGMSGIPLGRGAGELFGRGMFGFGAVLCWLAVVACVIHAARKLRSQA